MISEREAMLAAVLAEPEDDTRRLAFADWLQENGEGDRAEFIRVQVELAKSVSPENCDRTFCDGSLVVCTDCRKWKSLRKRERELHLSVVRSFVDGILDPHTHCRVVDVNTAQYDSAPGNRNPQHGSIIATATRGFLSAVTLRQDDFLKRGAAIFAAHPVERVTLSDREPLSGQVHTWWDTTDSFPPGRDDPYSIDPRIFYESGRRGGNTFRNFDTPHAAMEWLSARCVAFGRREAARAALTPC